MRGDLDYPYEPLAATDTPFAASLGDHAPNFNGIYGSSGSSRPDEQNSQWGDDGADRSPRVESPLPLSASGLSPRLQKPAPERSLLKPGSRKPGSKGHLHQRESRARCVSACSLPALLRMSQLTSLTPTYTCVGRLLGSLSMKRALNPFFMQTNVQSYR